MGSETATPGTGTDAGIPDAASIRAEALKAGNRGKLGATKGADKARAQIADMVSEEELDALFEGEQWEEIGALWFNTRFALTGDDGFLLTDKQQKRIGATMAMAGRVLLKLDPAYIAVILLTVNMGSLIAQKEVAHAHRVKQAKMARAQQQRSTPGA